MLMTPELALYVDQAPWPVTVACVIAAETASTFAVCGLAAVVLWLPAGSMVDTSKL